MRSALQKTAIAVVVTSFALALSGCGDDTPSNESGGKASTEAAKNPNIGKPGFDEKGAPYNQYNPSPEMIAKQKKDANDALPWTAKRDPQQIAERDQYVDMSGPVVPFLMYHATRTWDETPEDVSGSLGHTVTEYTNNPPGFAAVYNAYINEKNAFDKADALKTAAAWTEEYVASGDKRALVKLKLSPGELGIQPYNMATQSFSITSSLFVLKTENTDEERKQFRLSYTKLPPIRSSMYGPLSNYFFGFTNFENMVPMKVADEATARKIEGARQHLSMTVYGYVSDVSREHLGGVGKPQRTIGITPQFLDFEQDGQVIYTYTVN